MTPDPLDPLSISAFVRREGRGVVATVTPECGPQAALVDLCALDDGTLVFNSRVEARKVHNIAGKGRVAVVVGVVGEVSVQLEGTATVTSDEERERYGREYTLQFPGSRALDRDFAVVVVRPRWVRVYDTGAAPASVSEAAWSVAGP